MNTQKILELLGTTPKQKLNTLQRQEDFPVSTEMTANEMLNADLYGTRSKTSRPAKEGVIAKAPLPASAKAKIMASLKKRKEVPSQEGAGCDARTKLIARKKSAKESDEEKVATTDTAEDNTIYMNVTNADGEVVAYFDYDSEKLSQDSVATISAAMTDAGFSLAEADIDSDAAADEAAAAEGCGTKKRKPLASRECVHTEILAKKDGSAKEMMVDTGEGKFPDTFEFDEAAFADEYGIDADKLTCVYVAEDPEAQVSEHVEISFEYEESTVTLNIYADGTVDETVDAQIVDPQFSASFTQEEDEDGNMRDVLIVELLDEDSEEGASAPIQSEEDTLTKSEGDEDHSDEDGKGPTDEFIEEHGLDLDPFYSKQHKMPVADKGVHDVTNAARESISKKGKKIISTKKNATESLAAKIIRTRK